QGREGERDRILFSALTSPNLVLPWVGALARSRIPLTGICSVAMLSERLIAGIPASHVMLLSFQNGAGLRQSFFLNNRLNFSRLSLIHPGEDPLSVLQVESARSYNYLHTLNLLPEKGTLSVFIICDAQDRKKLAGTMEDTPALQNFFIDPSDAARRIGFRGGMSGSDAMPIFLHLLGMDANHYGNEEHRHLNDLRQLRLASNAFSATLVAAGLILAGIDASRAIGLHARAGILAARSDAVMLRYRSLVPPDTADSPQKMKAAVLLSRSLGAAYPRPERLLSLVSRALGPFPSVRLNRISWRTARENERSVISNSGEVVIDIEGEILAFDGNFRKANESVDNFCAELGKTGMNVTKIRLPLNLSPGASLVGKTGRERAEFSIKAVWKRAS
ncbi:MAG TPA: hypothetical protein PLK99_11945, partial [Burkholderiales bacterium]|nr:hypothetical protein [Burkholderiales bacterium]